MVRKMRTIRILTKKMNNTTTHTTEPLDKAKPYIDDDMLGRQYLGDSKASPYCRNIIRIKDPTIRSAFAILIASGCKGTDVDNFILTLAKQGWQYLDVLINNKSKTPLSNATQLKVKLSKGFKLELRNKPAKAYNLSDEINNLTSSKD